MFVQKRRYSVDAQPEVRVGAGFVMWLGLTGKCLTRFTQKVKRNGI
jgi:hypothetical protein